MKKIVNFIILLLSLAVVSSCNDDPAASSLTLSDTNIELKKYEIVTLSVETGNGRYKVESSNEMVVKVAVAGTTIAVYGVEGGTATVNVTDDLGKTETINVRVSFSVPTKSTFIWNKESYVFDVPDEYGISILKGMVALNNLEEYSQIVISWDGGFAEGEKTNGALRFITPKAVEESEAANEPIELTYIEMVRADPVKGYYMVFNDGQKSGELFFVK